MSIANLDSIKGRFLIWNISSLIIQEQPLLGVGIGNHQSHYMHAQANYFRSANPNNEELFLADNVNFVFNEYIHLLMEIGLIGCLGLIVIFIFLFGNINKYKITFSARTHISILILFGIFSLFSYPLQELPILILW